MPFVSALYAILTFLPHSSLQWQVKALQSPPPVSIKQFCPIPSPCQPPFTLVQTSVRTRQMSSSALQTTYISTSVPVNSFDTPAITSTPSSVRLSLRKTVKGIQLYTFPSPQKSSTSSCTLFTTCRACIIRHHTRLQSPHFFNCKLMAYPSKSTPCPRPHFTMRS